MRVIFLEDVANVARTGEVKDVKPGHARNYLLPKKLAVAATPQALQRLESIRKVGLERRVKELDGAQALQTRLEETGLTMNVRAGSTGRLYGAVTGAMIAAALSSVAHTDIERRDVLLDDNIHELGSFEVKVRLHAEVIATIALSVEPLQE